MGMLARGIPPELQAQMEAEDAIDLGWTRNHPSLHEPDGTRPARSFYPGWKLFKEHVRIEDALPMMQAIANRPIVGRTWEEIESIKRDDDNWQHLPFDPRLLQLLAKALGKTVFVTNVGMSDGAGVYEDITVFRIPPEGEIQAIDI